MSNKACNLCKAVRPITDFYRRKNGYVVAACKTCFSARKLNNARSTVHQQERKAIAIQRVLETLKLLQGVKQCKLCLTEKPLSVYWPKKQRFDGYTPYCKGCEIDRQRLCISNNRDHYYEKGRLQHIKHLASKKKNQKEYRGKNRLKLNRYQQEYRSSSPSAAIAHRIRIRINVALKRQSATKAASLSKVLGCSIPELKDHLERQFTAGMAWENRDKWHVDHIIPCAKFDLTDLEQQKLCFHYKNLQPLWKADNIFKSDRLPDSVQMHLPL